MEDALQYKQEAFYPLHTIRDDKYWPPVGRVDNLHGDRNLFCSCPMPDGYMGSE